MEKLFQGMFWLGIILSMIFAAKNSGTPASFSDMTPYFVGSALLSLVGVIFWRKSSKKPPSADDEGHLSITAAKEHVKHAHTSVVQMRGDLNFNTVCKQVDEVLGLFETIVNGRNDLAHHLPPNVWAQFYSDIASAERKLNRVWSMVSDGYRNTTEIQDLLRIAGEYIAVSEQHLPA